MIYRDVDLDFDAQSEEVPHTELLLATVGNYSSTMGTTLIFDGTNTATTKRYKRVGAASLSAGTRVLVAKLSGTYLILGRIY